MDKLIKAIKDLFKREVHTHIINNTAACCEWQGGAVLLLPTGNCYYMRRKPDSEELVITEIRLW